VAAKAKESLSNLPSMSSLAGGLGIPNSIGSLPGALSANITGLAGKLTSAQGLTNSLTGSLPSVEGALGQISNLAGGNPLSGLSSGAISNLQNSVVAKFGSVSAGAVTNALNSPLSNLMNGS